MTRTDIDGIPSVVQQIIYLPITKKVRVKYFDGEEELVNTSVIPKAEFDYWVIEQFLTTRKMSRIYDRQIEEGNR